MLRTFLLAILVLPAGCGEAPDGERKAAVGNIARTIQNEVSNQVEIPENVERNVDSGAGSWESSFKEISVTSSNGFATRRFEITVRNKASSPQKFGATIRLFDRDRNELRTRAVREFIISPYTDTKVEENLSMPENVSSRVSDSIAEVEVIPWEEEGPS